jgi:hypothetical protein
MKPSFVLAFILLLVLTGCNVGNRNELSVTIQGDSSGAKELSDYLAKHPIVADKSTGISYKLIIVEPDFKIRVYDPHTGQDFTGLSEQLTSTIASLKFKKSDPEK